MNNGDGYTARHLGYALTQDAPIDVTIQTLRSGTHLNLGKNLAIVPGRDMAFLLYDGGCVGIAEILHMKPRTARTSQIWTGPMRALYPIERVMIETKDEEWCRNARGGRYVLDEIEALVASAYYDRDL